MWKIKLNIKILTSSDIARSQTKWVKMIYFNFSSTGLPYISEREHRGGSASVKTSEHREKISFHPNLNLFCPWAKRPDLIGLESSVLNTLLGFSGFCFSEWKRSTSKGPTAPQECLCPTRLLHVTVRRRRREEMPWTAAGQRSKVNGIKTDRN